MRIEYLGHACFRVAGDAGKALVFDPYEPGCFGGALTYAEPGVSADVVFLSHDHADHGASGQISGSPKVVGEAGCGEHDGVSWVGVETCHDASGGAERGSNVIFNVTMDGVRLCHLGDLGHPLEAGQCASIGGVDVLFAPVGGHFTIDAGTAVEVARQLDPGILVPMHFKTDKVGFPIAPLDDFTAVSPWPVEDMGRAAEFAAGELPEATAVWIMEPSR